MGECASLKAVWCEGLPSFGIVGKDGKEKQPHMWEILKHCHVWEYLHSPYSIWCLGRLWALLLSQKPGPGIPSLCLDLLCRLTSVWVGGLWGAWVSPGVSPSSCHTHTCSDEAAKKQRWEVEPPGSLREPWLPYLNVSQCCLFLPPCTWNLIGNRPVWAEKVVSAWAVNWPAFVSLSQFYCCLSTMLHSASVTWRKAWQADVFRNSFQVQRGQGFPFFSAANPNFTFSF